MVRKLLFSFCFVLLPVAVALAQDPPAKPEEAKELSGMSIVGNDEAPKSLYIVPWKSSELGVQTSLQMPLNEDDRPVDRDVFLRELAFYQVRTGEAAPAAGPGAVQ